MTGLFALTLDVDWAPDNVIDSVAAKLVAAEVPATWFVTHASPAIERLRERGDLFELGIHPNFLPGSTHGNSIEEVLRHCMGLVPVARCMRTHGLYQATFMLDKVAEYTSIEFDTSILLHRAPVAPAAYHWAGRPILRLPFVWEDDIEARQPHPDWSAVGLHVVQGPCIVNFHPMLIALNAAHEETYSALRRDCPDIPAVTEELVTRHRWEGAGPCSMFDDLLERLSETGAAVRVSDLAESDTVHGVCAPDPTQPARA